MVGMISEIDVWDIAGKIAFGMLLLLIVFNCDYTFSDFFSSIWSEPPGYTDREVQELSGFIREIGVDIPNINVLITDLNKTSQFVGYEYTPCAWTSIRENEGIIWITEECSSSYYVIGHEMAHQVLFEKYPDMDGDLHHGDLEFRMWEACLSASGKFHYNVCKVLS